MRRALAALLLCMGLTACAQEARVLPAEAQQDVLQDLWTAMTQEQQARSCASRMDEPEILLDRSPNGNTFSPEIVSGFLNRMC